MRLASIPLALLLVLTACTWAPAQPPERKDREPPPPPRDAAPAHDQSEGDKEKRSRGWHDRQEPMTEQQLREAVKVLRQIDPEKADRLETYVDENPGKTGRELHEQFPKLGRFMAWRSYDPAGFDLRIKDMAFSRKTHECVKRLHEALDEGNAEIAALEQIQLSDLVAEHFDIRQQIREHDLAKLQEQIEKLQADLENRAANRDELIEQRLEELVTEGKSERW